MGDKHTPCTLEMDILKKIGDNKTKEKTFNDGIKLKSDETNELLGFYTYKGEVCVLDGKGMDNTFSSYCDDDKAIIHKAIISDKFIKS